MSYPFNFTATMSQSLLAQSVAQCTAYEVVLNEIAFLPFGAYGLTSIGTANMNGCSAVVVLSKLGAILAHIAPLPHDHVGNPEAGDEHAQSKMDLLKSIYRSNEQYFPPGSAGWVVCAMFEGVVALPDQQRIFQRALSDLNLPCSLKTYTVAATRACSGTSPGHGTVFIQENGNNPRVYIEDVEVTIRDLPGGGASGYTAGYSSRSGSGSSPTSYSVAPAELSTYAPESTTHTYSDGPYYHIRDNGNYYYENWAGERLWSRPKNVWIFKETGWADTESSQKWRFWDGKSASYR